MSVPSGMMPRVTNPSYRAIESAVRRAKAGSALRPVTVVVPGFGAARDVLRHLAAHGGVANTRVETVDQVVDRLAAPLLRPRVALPYPLLEASAQKILDEAPGVFVDVAGQSVTAQAVASASWELSEFASPPVAPANRLVADVLRIHAAVTRAHAGRYFMRHEAYAAACTNLQALGSIVVYAPECASPAHLPVVAALQRHGATVPVADAPLATSVVHASDADDEVRSVARLVRRHLAEGVPGHRIGVYYGSADPYLRLIDEHFREAGIRVAAPASRSLVDRPAARSLVRLLALDSTTMPRRELLAILAERAVVWADVDGARLRQRAIENITRTIVPIVGGADWDRLAEVPADSWCSESAATLSDLVTSLQRDLRGVHAASTWDVVAERLVALVDRYFAPTPDAAALRTIAARLGEMVVVAPPPSPRRVAEAMDVRVRAVVDRSGAAGVAVGQLAAGVGRDLDVCVVVGAAEGMVPAPRRENPLLPGALLGTGPADDIERQRRQFEHTLGSGVRHRVVTFPRGSLRGGAEKVPSRWLLASLAALAGRPVGVTTWQADTAGADAIVGVESFDVATQFAEPRIGVAPASATEWRLRALAEVPARRRQERLSDAVVRAGMQMRSDRLNGRFTRFNGNVSNVAGAIGYFADPVPPTRLEEWVTSPYLFFVRQILGVEALPDPEVATQLDPLSRGNLVHKVLEDYIAGCIAGEPRSLDRLLDIGDDVLASARFAAPGWLPQLWEKDNAVIRRDLIEWYARDNADHAAGWSPVAAEQGFDDVGLDLASGPIRFAGKVDRIDHHRDGRVRVTDYKTGSADPYTAQKADSPTGGGRRFQLPVYGLFAQSVGGGDVAARYWFVSSKAKFTEIGYAITGSVVDSLRAGVGVVHAAIEAGYFPPMPPGTHWQDDLLDLIGEAGLERAWVALGNVPELADFSAIHQTGVSA